MTLRNVMSRQGLLCRSRACDAINPKLPEERRCSCLNKRGILLILKKRKWISGVRQQFYKHFLTELINVQYLHLQTGVGLGAEGSSAGVCLTPGDGDSPPSGPWRNLCRSLSSIPVAINLCVAAVAGGLLLLPAMLPKSFQCVRYSAVR